MNETSHATCVDFAGIGILIRGRSGSGKTTLALALLDEARGRGSDVKLVSDDRVVLINDNEELIASAPETIAGSIEIRGLGIMKIDHVDQARVGLVVDLVEDENLERVPEDKDQSVLIKGIKLPRIVISENNPHAAMIVRFVLETNKRPIS